MKNILLLLLLLSGAATSVHAFGDGAKGCSGDCTSCHSLTMEEARGLLGNLEPAVTVEKVARAQVPGLYQLDISSGEKKGTVFLDFSKRYLLQASIIDLKPGESVKNQAAAPPVPAVIDTAKIPLDYALVLGNPNGKRKLYVFSDPDCPYCADLHDELRKLVSDERDLAVYVILTPLAIHPDAGWKTNAIVEAARRDMKLGLAMLEEAFQKVSPAKVATVIDYGRENSVRAAELGITMTPVVVTHDGSVYMGFREAATFKNILDGRSLLEGKK